MSSISRDSMRYCRCQHSTRPYSLRPWQRILSKGLVQGCTRQNHAKPESEIMGCNWCKNWTMAMKIQKRKRVCRNPCHLLYILALLARLLGPVPSCCWVRKLSKAAVPSRDEARLRIQPQSQEKQSASHTCLCMCLCPGWSSTSEFFGPVSEIVFHFSLASWGHMRTWWILGTLRLGTSLTCSKQAWQNIWLYRDCQEPCT